MSIYLVQHGQSLSKEQDAERGLSDEGKSSVDQAALMAGQRGIDVDRIVHSGKKRAKQTAELFAEVLKPSQGVAQMDGLNPMDAVEPWAISLQFSGQTMLVGHLPFMARLAGLLVTGSADQAVFRFRNGAVVCLEPGDGERWVITDVIISVYKTIS